MMALKLAIPFPIFVPILSPKLNPTNHRPPSEIRFSRWNNANAEKFNRRHRTQKEIEDDIRRHRRFDSATKIAQSHDSATTTTLINDVVFKSTGTPSPPSRPSIPGKKSKYSKPADPSNDHPAFRGILKRKITNLPPKKPPAPSANVVVSDDGLSYAVDGAPFEFKYSYTETPKVKPLNLREAEYVPFGPTTMGRPWTGRAPLPPSKKKLKEFDSFELPPPNKKGVKPVQKPGPFLPGTGPKYVSSREEILGEPLTKEEVEELVESCRKSSRQLNMGRDGLTHNMLDNIHAHWKRRRVCKIKCKGVCTVDMDNVCQQLEDLGMMGMSVKCGREVLVQGPNPSSIERTGGKIISRRGGVLYLFRGRNYNYKTRPRFPLMLWKPVTPVYPRLIRRVPEGLTLEEATEMRKKGRKLIPVGKLGKNGVYCDLVKNVREAFEVCELVRINCQGMNGSDYHKIGAKLRDLVPCILISFEHEHILMWRGQNWKSSLPKLDNDSEDAKKFVVDGTISVARPVDDDGSAASCTHMFSIEDVSLNTFNTSISHSDSEAVHAELHEDLSSVNNDAQFSDTENLSMNDEGSSSRTENLSSVEDEELLTGTENLSLDDDEAVSAAHSISSVMETTETMSDKLGCSDEKIDALKIIDRNVTKLERSGFANGELEPVSPTYECETELDNKVSIHKESIAMSIESQTLPEVVERTEKPSKTFSMSSSNYVKLQNLSEVPQDQNEPARLHSPNMEKVLFLMQQAVENGSALILNDASLDADNIYERSVAFAKAAPPGPVYSRQPRPRKIAVQKSEKLKAGDLKVLGDVVTVSEKGGNAKRTSRKAQSSDEAENCLGIVPHGSLRVDELAKLLA